MLLIETLYGLFFALALFSALMVVLARHAVYSALYLVLTMISMSGLFLLMNAKLAAFLQIIVYAGAIMVLFLFVIMLLSLGKGDLSPRNRGVRAAGLLLAGAFLAQMFVLLATIGQGEAFSAAYTLDDPSKTDISLVRVGGLLQTEYLYAFAMTSILLLVAMIGAIVMARRHLLQGVWDETKKG